MLERERQRMVTVMQKSDGVPEAGAWIWVEAKVCVYTNEECLTLYKMRYFSAGICGPNSLFYKLDEQLI